jgi:hypothetical protein
MVGAGEVIARYGLPEQSLLETGLGHERHTEQKIDPSSLGNDFSIVLSRLHAPISPGVFAVSSRTVMNNAG